MPGRLHAGAAEFAEVDAAAAVDAEEQGWARLLAPCSGPLAPPPQSYPSHIDCDPPHRHTK